MTNFENLPNEVLMKIFSFLNIIDVTHVAQVSKKLRNFCNDEDVMQKFVEKINLYNKKVPTTFLEKILDYGCKYLSLNTACLEAKNGKNNGKITLKRPCQLKYLDVSDCGGNKKFLLESLLESCNTLEKLALQNGLQDVKGSPINYGKLFLQNAQTLQVLNLTGYHHRSSLDSWGIEDVIRSCINLTEFTPFTLESHYEVLKLVEGITPNIRKLNLNFIYKVESQHVKILVERCKKLKELNLRRTHICDLSVDYIVENSSELEKLDLSQNDPILFRDSNWVKLGKLPMLRTLVIESGAYSTKNVSELRKLAPHVTEILQKPPSIHSTLGIANPYKNYTAEEGFWEIQAKQFPLFFCVIDKETEEWHYDAINSYHSINDMSSDDDEGAFMDYL